jgi:hypothetical protein
MRNAPFHVTAQSLVSPDGKFCAAFSFTFHHFQRQYNRFFSIRQAEK